MYRRIGERQQQLFSAAARINPEYFGTYADGTLDANKAISFATMGDRNGVTAVPNPDLISRIEVLLSSGGGAPAVGTEIHIVPLTDPDAALAPRMTLRGGTLAPVSTDLAQVTKIRMFYSKSPFRVDAEDGGAAVELPEAYQNLLVLDLARYLLRKTASLTKEVREVALAALEAEEQESLAAFLAHVKELTSASERGRFGRTQGSTKQ